MTTIHASMLVLLGFLIAALFGFVFLPAFWARAVRLTQQRLRAAMPLTESEIKADRDRLKADFAIQIHKLSTSLEDGKLNAARQLIELNRRDAAISNLERDLDATKVDLEEHRNARRVLEQTIADRIPKVEQRLAEAKKLLFERDREIASQTAESERALHALDQAGQINAQRQVEITRLRDALTHRGGMNRDSLRDARFDAETALRSEIEALRTQSRDQSALIEKLTAQPARDGGMLIASELGASEPETANAMAPSALNGAGASSSAPNSSAQSAGLASAAFTQPSAPPPNGAPDADGRRADAAIASLEAKLRTLAAEAEEKSTEIAGLKASLATFEGGDVGRAPSLKDSKLALKAKLSALQVEVGSQSETIKRLRAEVAASNERLARQASHFMEEMKRLGAGTLPASGALRAANMQDSERRKTLADRLIEAQPQLATDRFLNAPSAESGANSAERNGHSRDGAYAPVLRPVRRLSVLKPVNAVSPQAEPIPAGTPVTPEPAAESEASGPPKSRLAQRLADLAKT